MPPKRRFSEKQVVEAALEGVQCYGVEWLTARNLAKHLGSSTAPIFGLFPSMERVHEQVIEAAIERFISSLSVGRGSEPLIGAGVGWLRFAASEPRLYEALFLRRHPWTDKLRSIRTQWVQQMLLDPSTGGISAPTLDAMVGRASVVMHGLGVEIWSGRVTRTDFERLVSELVLPLLGLGYPLETHSNPHARKATDSAHAPRQRDA